MSELAALAYFCPPEETFWSWDDHGNVVSWSDGRTLAFREELDRILEALLSSGLPHFDLVLLLVAACRDGWNEEGASSRVLTRLAGSLDLTPVRRGAEIADLLSIDVARRLVAQHLVSHREVHDRELTLVYMVDQALSQLNRVHRLFSQSMGGLDRMELLVRHVLQAVAPRRSPREAGMILGVFRQGFSPDGLVGAASRARLRPPSRERLIEVANDLLSILRDVREDELDVEHLARTGLEDVPAGAEIHIPASRQARAVVDQLLADEKLHGLARLARELLAVVQLPRRLEDSDELPSGGFSDLTNRGPLDRLVLGELAHDSMTLAVRVAMNEALYLRREVPPRGPERARALLVDRGIRLWGLPRVFAAATALAVTATADPGQDVRAFAARGDEVEELDLLSRDGLSRHLETLETGTHSGGALRAFAAECERRAIGDAVFITQEDVFADPEFRRTLEEVWVGELHVATVNRDGVYRLRRWTARGTAEVHEARLDLERILRRDEDASECAEALRGDERVAEGPLMLALRPLPLRVPSPIRSGRVAWHERFGMASVTKDNRFLYWEAPAFGPIELVDRLPRGTILLFEIASDGWAYVVFDASSSWAPSRGDVQRRGGVAPLLRVHLKERRHEIVELRPTDDRVRGVLLQNGGLIWVGESTIEVFSPQDGARVSVLRTPPSPWRSRGRIFSRAGRHRVLHFDGKTVSLSEEQPARADRAESVIGFFERAGFDGPWYITLDGKVGSTANEEESRLPLGFSGRLALLAVSEDGHRLALRDCDERDSGLPIAWDLETGTAERTRELDRALCPWLTVYRRPERANIFTRVETLRRVVVTTDRTLVLQKRDGVCYRLAGRDAVIDFTVVHSSDAEVAAWPGGNDLESRGGESGHDVRMAVATWPDGSEVIVDGRGLLHLRSANAELPEVTLLLRIGGDIAGWASTGEVYGPIYYHGMQRTVESTRFYRYVTAFLDHLPLTDSVRR